MTIVQPVLRHFSRVTNAVHVPHLHTEMLQQVCLDFFYLLGCRDAHGMLFNMAVVLPSCCRPLCRAVYGVPPVKTDTCGSEGCCSVGR